MYRTLTTTIVAVLLCAVTVRLSAQETRGAIFGRVTDPQATAVPGAAVTVRNLDTNATFVIRTNDTGYYEASLLLPGPYQVTVSAQGFRELVRKGVNLALGGRLDVSVRLEVGAVSETITVNAESPLLDTGHVSAGRVLDTQTIESLPIFYGNTTDLLRFAPTVFNSGVNASTNGFFGLAPGMDTTMAGGVGQNTFSLDGAPNIARSGPSDSTAYQPAEDFVQEVKIETFNFDASIGHTTGIHMGVVTKSGTNRFHGMASDLLFEQRWNATPFFTKQNYFTQIAQALAQGNTALANQLRSLPQQPSGHANTYAAGIGGPVVIPKLYSGKNKLFFFFGFNGIAFRSTDTPTSLNHTVPTVAERTGDFSDLLRVNAAIYQIYDPLTVQTDPSRSGHYIRQPFPGNIIPTSRIVNPAYSAYTKLLPIPNNSPNSATQEPLNNYYAANTPQVYDYKAFTNRTDYQFSEKNRVFLRWNWNDWLSDRTNWMYSTDSGLPESLQYRRNWGGAFNWVFTPTSTTVLDVTLSDNDHLEGNRPTPAQLALSPSAAGLPSYLNQLAGSLAIAPSMILSGYDTLGPVNNGYPTLVHTRLDSQQATLSHVHGNHTLRAGADARQYYKNQTAGGNTSGNFSFNSAYTQRNDDSFTPVGTLGYSYAAFLLGVPSSMTVTEPASLAMHNPAYGWFLQDDYRVNPKLTLNLGVRFEFEAGPTERYNRMLGPFNPSASLPISAAAAAAYSSSPIPELAASSFVVQGGSVYPGVSGASRALWQNGSAWMPRLGAAYQLNGKTVLRAGYGMFYDSLTAWTTTPSQLGFSSTTTTVASNNYGVTWNAGTNPMTDPFPVLSTGSRFVAPLGASMGAMAVAGTSFSFSDPNAERARQQRWTAGVQRQLGATTMIEVSYAGSRSDHVYIGGGYNDSLSVIQNLNALPAQYWASGATGTPATANASNLTANVANPFYLGNFTSLQSSNAALYQYMASNSFFTRATVPKNQLLLPYPQLSGLTESLAPLGQVRTQQLDVNLQRRFSRGLSLNASYTRLRNRTAANFLNPYDTQPTWQEGALGRPHRFEATGVWEFPIGRGRRWLNSGVVGSLVGGFQLGASYEWQPGPLIQFSTNLFYNGDVSAIASGPHILSEWFNTQGFQRTAALGPQQFQSRTFPLVVPNVRADMENVWNANVQRNFRIRERMTFQIRAEALDLLNRSQFSAPNTNPYSTNFGVVTSTTASYNRFLQFLAKVQF